jgi:hypothetical protein
MTFERIKELINLLPDNSSYFSDVLSYTPQITAINKFLCAYKDLAFGYHLVQAFVKDNIQLPPYIDEEILYSTYMFEKFGEVDMDIVQAISFTHPSNKNMEDAIKAAIISDIDYTSLSKIYGIPKRVIEAYEQLFFNVRDRKQEALFIANLVYPDTKFVELNENYLKEEDKGRLLMRSAYNNGLADTSYFIGLKNMENLMVSGMNSVDAASQLESAIMLNGLFLARNGAMNTKNAGLGQAKGILIAAKQGGQDTSNMDMEGIGSLGDLAIQTLKDMTKEELKDRAEAIAKTTMLEIESSSNK